LTINTFISIQFLDVLDEAQSTAMEPMERFTPEAPTHCATCKPGPLVDMQELKEYSNGLLV